MASLPSWKLDFQRSVFQLGIVFQSIPRPFAPDARRFYSPKGGDLGGQCDVVQADHPRLNPLDRAKGVTQVFCVNISREPERCIVCKHNRFVFGVEPAQCGDRAEDLLTQDRLR